MYTKEECKARLEMWLKAEEIVAVGGQSYEVQGRSLSRADLREIREQIKLWETRLYRASGGSGIRFGKAVIS